MQKIKEFLINIKDQFINLDKNKKIAICIGIVAIIVAITFGVSYSQQNKYGVLYSGLDSIDAATVTKSLEDAGVETKIEGDIIYVPKEQVDKLRIELSSSITNGSKGFELMDEGSSLSMTDEEFQIKKIRMIQGELEKTIKTFSAVEDARVHITQGQESVFSSETTEGKAAVYVSIKAGEELNQTQIKSIMSLVSASTTNIPKKNVEIIDQNMNLLSEGIYDEDGNALNGIGTSLSRSAEKEVSEELQQSIVSMLEGIFGKDKVKVTVNATLNYDTVQKNEVVINPDTVIKSENRSENTTSNGSSSGSPVDNNMTNTTESGSNGSSSIEEQIEYEVGKTEITTITSPGDIKTITAAVAIDGSVSDDIMYNVEKMVSSALGINADRGDQLTVVAMAFNNDGQDIFADSEENVAVTTTKDFLKYGLIAGGLILALIVTTIILLTKKKKSNTEDEIAEVQEDTNDLIAKLVKEKEAKLEKEIAMEESELSLEDEIKLIVSKNTDDATELIKTWLSE
ncbi:flagellar basal-body MS-ring/collar protein FliF [Clostridium saudiense]|uniref:flagellar basal-body MS-ring/collar protein FliF n=1 Tax=Clostridium saudiense TaxID=1414720 RepID=UPI0018A8D0A5|nr:flagellar basal-body MS-ring/collar protein FliF [Clostridium saudiense]